MTIEASYVRTALGVVALCGLGLLVTLMSHGADNLGVQSGMWPVLMIVLAVGTVALPIIGLLGKIADSKKFVTAVIFALGLFSNAVFLDARFDVFPARVLCIIGLLLCFAGVIASLARVRLVHGNQKEI